ncbi:type II CRISPR-associated endonuclease Cas1 [Corynebacterium cystitidis]|uniref:type II CRISPR-associated endonuclease Cas1 n=1 Tax=Corynebacterium cystitidis TaxID=35757 RepID=UPI00211E71B2|nr:type II CRISPR-associated endonuclease Cas1 [Corynebacterium cystitidis]
MNPGWRIIDCTNLEGSIRYSRGQIVIYSSETDQTTPLPLAQIAVVLIGVQVSISGAALLKLGEFDVAVLVCDWKNIPVAGAFPWSPHTRIGARHNAQASLSRPAKKRAWAQLVKTKIQNQATTAQAVTGSDPQKLHDLARKVLSGDSSNVEAQAARHYWSLLSESRFTRLPGQGLDPWNGALDYGYTILRGIGIRSVAAAGLCGTLGVFHKGRDNSFALVDDLIEPFRPMVDQIVFTQIDLKDELESQDKQTIVETLKTIPFTSTGTSVSTAFEELAQDFGLYVEGQKESLTPPLWKGEINACDRI